MAIKIACQCGQRFEAKDRLAGKTLKCPKCGLPLKIPETTQAALAIVCQCGQKFTAKAHLAGKTLKCPECGSPLRTPAPKRPAKPKPPTQPKRQPEVALPGPMGNLLDEVGLDGQSPPNICPSCRVVMPRDAIVCVHCGYHQQLGKKMETEQEAVGRAIPQGSRRERRGISSGSGMSLPKLKNPALVWAIPLGVLVLTVAMILIPQLSPLVLVGIVIVSAGLILVGGIWAIGVAFSEDIVCGLMYLFVPFYALYYLISRWPEMRKPFITSAAGFGLFFFGLMWMQICFFISLCVSPR